MSRNSKGLPDDVEDVAKFISSHLKYGYLEEVWLRGSRSPKTKRDPKPDSDWDIIFLCNIPNLRLQSPRLTKQLNACLWVEDLDYELPKEAVQLYPKNETNYELRIPYD